MSELSAKKRQGLPNSAFAYVDAKGRRRLPIHDEAHVRNALARFSRVVFEDEAARDKARRRLLTAAKKHGIVPIGFMTGQLRSARSDAVAGRLVIELGASGAPEEFEQRLRVALRDPTLSVLQWSDSADAYLDGTGQPVALPSDGEHRAMTLLERHGRPMTALIHDAAALDDPDLVKTVTAVVRLAVENQRLQGEVEARTSEVGTLPRGLVTFLMTDIEDSTGILRQIGDRYVALLADIRATLRTAVLRAGGREVDARADELLAAFADARAALDAAIAIQRTMGRRAWPDGRDVRVRIGIHSGRPTLTDTGYVGLPVNVVARICSAGHGGEILLSAAARDAIGDQLGTGVSLRDLGPHALRGVPEPQTLVQVEAPDLPAEFPAPRTGGAA